MAFKQNFSALVSNPEGFATGSELENKLIEGDTINTLHFHANLPMDARVSGNRMEQRLISTLGQTVLTTSTQLDLVKLEESSITVGGFLDGLIEMQSFHCTISTAELQVLVLSS